MTEAAARRIREQPRFRGIFKDNGKFDREIALSHPGAYGDGGKFTGGPPGAGVPGENTSGLEKEAAGYIGVADAVALNSGMDAARIAVKLAAEQAYGAGAVHAADRPQKGGGLSGRRVFCSDFMPPAAVEAVIGEGGEPVFIDVSAEDWGMDPEVLEIAFETYRDVKLVIMNHAYGFPGQVKEVKRVCGGHGALLIEDASESLGAEADGRRTGSFGDYGILDFGRGMAITGISGGMLLAGGRYGCQKAERYGRRMDDAAAAEARGQLHRLEGHIKKKKAVYKRYAQKFDGGIISMNPVGEGARPNYWISCMTCDSNIQFRETRSGRGYTYTDQHGTASPMEVYDALAAFGVQSGPVYRPLSLYPEFKRYDQVSLDGGRRSWAYGDGGFWARSNVSKGCFERGLCLPSDTRMTEEEQGRVMDIVLACFSRIDLDRGLFY